MEDELVSSHKRIYKFVITGGPCAGKTTAMERMQVYLRERGFRVFVVPEAATMLFLNGASPDDLASVECERAFQSFVIKTQIQLEDSFQNYARACGKKSVLLCDRGLMDGSAYVTDEIWAGVLKSVGLDIISARDTRYDAIFHLVTAADGASTFYTLSNNEARHESAEEAIAQDRKTQHAWNGHPQHIIIDNRKNRPFERKMELLISMLSGYVGLPSVARKSYKYELQSVPDLSHIVGLQVFDVEKIMLAEGAGSEPTRSSRMRSRSLGESIGSPNKSSGHVFGTVSTISNTMTGEGTSSTATATATAAEEVLSNSFDACESPEREELSSEDDFVLLYSFIRCRSQGGFHAYGLTTVKMLPNGEKVELKQVISKRMYSMLSNNADPARRIVRQKRYCFQWERQSFQIYEYLEPWTGYWTVQCQAEAEPVIPEFLDVAPMPTGLLKKASSSRDISLKDVLEAPEILRASTPPPGTQTMSGKSPSI